MQAHNVKLSDIRTPKRGVQVLRHHTSTVCGVRVSLLRMSAVKPVILPIQK